MFNQTATRTRLPAKLVRPTTTGAILRTRLFSQIDRLARDRPVVWIVGPPGAGKTVLASTYVQQRQLKTLWYRFDATDRDPASFFFYLTLAGSTLPCRRRHSLPLLSAEYLSDLAQFSRRFFRQLFDHMPDHGAIVIDDFHEVGDDSTLTGLMQIFFEELPERLSLIVTSRTDPPASLARQIASERISFVDWNFLRLTNEETRRIVNLRLKFKRALAHDLNQMVDGWAAGVTLAVEHLLRVGTAASLPKVTANEAVFDYFASEIFDRLPAETKPILAALARLPRFSQSMARQLTQSSQVTEILDYLHRHRVFTNRFVGAETTYEFHTLFREFLRSRAPLLLTPAEERTIALRAATLLETSGDIPASLSQYLFAQEPEPAVQMLVHNAAKILAQGRGAAFRSLAEEIPLEVGAKFPWLGYWHAASLVPLKPTQARRNLEHAYQQFKSGGDEIGQIFAASSIVEAYRLEHNDYRSFAQWLPRIEQLLQTNPNFSDDAVKLRVYASLLAANILNRPSKVSLDRCVDMVGRLLHADVVSQEKVSAGTILLYYACNSGDLSLATQVLATVSPCLQHAGVTPLVRLTWLGFVGLFHLHFTPDRAGSSCTAAALAFDTAIEIAEAEGLQRSAAGFIYMRACCAWIAGDADGAKVRGKALASQLNNFPPLVASQVKQLVAMLALAEGDIKQAVEHTVGALAAAREADFFFLEATWSILHAFVLAESNAHDELTSCLAAGRELIAGTYVEHYEADYLLIESYASFRQGKRSEAIALLDRAFALLDPWHVFGCRFLPGLLSRLCHEALIEQVRVEQVREFIQRFEIKPYVADAETWPWPIRIHALGPFAIEIDGKPLAQPGKQQKRPLMLLKALVGHAERELSIADLSAWLWPDLDGDSARSAFNMAVHRLRKLLGNDQAISIRGGTIALAEDYCWTDVRAFQTLCSRTRAAFNDVAAPRALIELADRCLKLYRGELLASDEASPWLITQRDRLRSMLDQEIDLIGSALESVEQWEAAVRLYQRSVDINPLAEEHYRRLMNGLSKQNRYAEAIATYRRCRQTLSVVLGVEPKPSTRMLYEAIRSAQSKSL